jgi:hypothetical protein
MQADSEERKRGSANRPCYSIQGPSFCLDLVLATHMPPLPRYHTMQIDTPLSINGSGCCDET